MPEAGASPLGTRAALTAAPREQGAGTPRSRTFRDAKRLIATPASGGADQSKLGADRVPDHPHDRR